MKWYALQHKPAQGDRAVEHLQNQRIACFYPKVPVEKVRAGKRVTRLEPLFPGYLFVQLEPTDPAWSKLRSTRGVLRVVSFANKPAFIADEVIQAIKASLRTIDELGGLKPGQPIAIEDGPFKGLEAIFQSYDGDERAIVLINFMQRHQSVAVPLANIKT
ncbi:transcription/translation regulatory transformer protein RfaH [Marinobacter sp. X15-166B]|uniref:transcription/translation regulatory transformer protein RfaH n=1 Tax=Marinobacter sp. X15-166B TaxID=1897620 RepID=UPI00085CCA30|nr:transcription/translation regulatory transformer protein RfaH [Marinobacter sp. X15-166B]OEY65165.1 transcriptional regulator [Marinobacter sp. X15-166B]